ncbi:MAG: ribonuclease HI [Chloroflexota bacterium]
MSEEVIIYSDGGSDPNPGIGGWAAILQFGKHEKVLTGNDPETTNNRMELTAAVRALQALKRPCSIQFYTDSQYLRRGITEWIDGWEAKGWKSKSGKPIQNVDLWQTLKPLVGQHTIEWHWVKGHAGNVMNERVDILARQARLDITPEDTLPDDVPKLYLRASYKGKTGNGAWGAVLEADGETEQYSGTAVDTSNNRMELTAAIEGILMLPAGSSVQIFTSSDYVFQGITKWIIGWRKRNWVKRDEKPVANADLWQALDELTNQYSVKWVNAKGKDLRGLNEAGKIASETLTLI